MKPLRASAKVATASTQTGAAVEAAPSITAGIAVVSAGRLRKRSHVHVYRQCEHGRQKHKCKDCSPKSFCRHGRLKGRCKDCGAGYCQHGRQKDRCKDCGTGYCQHGRQNGRCRDCRR
jgi:hypothetical protein